MGSPLAYSGESARIAWAHKNPLPASAGCLRYASAGKFGDLTALATWKYHEPSDGCHPSLGSSLILRAQPHHNAGSTGPQCELCVPACRDSFEVGLVDRPVFTSDLGDLAVVSPARRG